LNDHAYWAFLIEAMKSITGILLAKERINAEPMIAPFASLHALEKL
jgi:hypothetical protein